MKVAERILVGLNRFGDVVFLLSCKDVMLSDVKKSLYHLRWSKAQLKTGHFQVFVH